MKKIDYVARVALVVAVCCVGTAMAAPVASPELSTQAPTARRAVTGVVTDFAGNTIPGVSVSLLGAPGVGTSTDAQGRYSIFVARGATLEFTYVGMVTRAVAVADQETINVQMDEEAFETGTVVVTGVFDRPQEAFTGAANLISQTELRASSTQNLIQGIANVDPSFKFLTSNQFGSDPNKLASANITMRGGTALMDYQNDAENALAANRPLFIIDGFPATIEEFIALDQSRVQSVTTLKDAAATALYGTQAANGVVVITTVQPEEGRLKVRYNGTYTVSSPDLGSYNLMNASEKLEFEKASGLYDAAVLYPNPTYAQQASLDQRYYDRMMNVARGVDTDWLRYPLRTAFSHNHALTLEGGENAIRYSVDVSNNRQSNVMKESYRNTFNGGMYLNYKVSNFVFANRMTVTSVKGPNSPYGSFSAYSKMNAYYMPYDINGDLIRNLDESGGYGAAGSADAVRQNSLNPLWERHAGSWSESREFNIRNNFMADWKVTDYFTVKGQFSVNSYKNRYDAFVGPESAAFQNYAAEDIDRKGTYEYRPSDGTSMEGRLSAQYSRYFNEKHFFLVGVSGRYNSARSENYSIVGEGITIPELDFFPAANMYQKDGNPGGDEKLLRQLSGTFLANYMYDERYYADLTVTMDGSSEYGSSVGAAPTGSLGIGWNLHRENFMTRQNVLSRARLRASYGIVGSAGSYNAYDALRIYELSEGSYRGQYGMNLESLGNPDLRWQSTKQFNAGVDLGFMDDRFSVIFDWYDKVTDDLLVPITLPTASGLSRYMANIGSVRNRGFELQASAKIIRNRERHFEWTVMANAQQNKNTILDINSSLDSFNDDILTDGSKDKQTSIDRNPAFLFKEGESMKTLFAVKSLGIDPATGQEIFEKLDGTQTTVWDSKDRQAFGVAEATLWGTFGTTVRWKNFAMTAYFAYRMGGYAYNDALATKVENTSPYNNLDRRAYTERWQKPGDVTSFKGVREWDSSTNATSRFIAKDNQFECTSISLQYTVPQEWAKKHLGASFIELQAQTENLFTLSTLETERGIGNPFARQYSMTVRLTF